MTASPKPNHQGSGFTLGVALGAIVGAGAIIALGEKKSGQARRHLISKFHDYLNSLKAKYPQETEHFESLIAQSLAELSQTNQEIHQKAAEATAKAKTVADTLKSHTPPKKTFTQKGKSL